MQVLRISMILGSIAKDKRQGILQVTIFTLIYNKKARFFNLQSHNYGAFFFFSLNKSLYFFGVGFFYN